MYLNPDCFYHVTFLFIFRAESQMFKARFSGWDDVLAVDYTLSADYVSKAAKQLGVSVRKGFLLL